MKSLFLGLVCVVCMGAAIVAGSCSASDPATPPPVKPLKQSAYDRCENDFARDVQLCVENMESVQGAPPRPQAKIDCVNAVQRFDGNSPCVQEAARMMLFYSK